MPEPGCCETCGKESVFQCDQCGAILCNLHRTVVETELGAWSRCRSCNLQNRIRESPLVTWMRFENEVESFFLWVWFLVFAVLTVIFIVFRTVFVAPH